MKQRKLPLALMVTIAASALVLTSCSTTQSRISDHPEIFQSLSANDQALVSQGQIRVGMPRDAVWLAWGSPEQKAEGAMRGKATETWVYITYSSGYPYGPYGYPYGPYGRFYGGVGFGFVSATHGGHFHHFHNRDFIFFGDPFFDPFFYSYIPASIPVPYKTVTFANGRVASFQYLSGYR